MAVLLSVSGTYTVRVSYNNQYFGEYRLRVTLARPPLQLESEDNNNLNTADVPAFAVKSGHQTATMLGYVGVADANGDYFKLGNLEAGTVVNFGLRLPGSSQLSPILWIYDGSGTVVTNSPAGGTNLSFSLTAADAYYARVTADAGTAGLFAQYLLDLDLADVLAPMITSVTLPAEGSTNHLVIDRFDVAFSKDMEAGSVTNAADYDLRSAGPDGVFGTPDDGNYRVANTGYTSGLTTGYAVTDGPLQPGYYRFTILAGVQDRFGNFLPASYTRFFTVESLPGYTIENRDNDIRTNATPVTLIEDPTGLLTGGGQGKLFDNQDVDYWSFSGTAGESLVVGVDIPGNPSNSQLYYRVDGPDGSKLTDFYAQSNNGYGQSGLVVLPADGVYTVRVAIYDGYHGEYRIRLSLAVPPLQLEEEDNDSIAGATPVMMTTNANASFGRIAGYIRLAGDLDYFDLGTVTNGSTVFLATHLPAGGTLTPVVSLYDAANGYLVEAAGGRPSDGVAEVRISQTGTYYAVVRGASGSGGLSAHYVLDVQVVPTGSVSFPNLQVTAVTLPTGSIQSGQSITFSFTVGNVGSVTTSGSSWSDRAVLSQNTVLGDTDDVLLGIFSHTGALNSGASYTVTPSALVAEGVHGDYYILVQTDLANAINEFVLEGDNTTVSSGTFHIDLAPYPDLKVEGLTVTGPDAFNVFNLDWTTANRGNLGVATPFRERVVVRNLTTGATLIDAERVVSSPVAPGATLALSTNVTATAPGNYQVTVITDSADDIFEYDAVSHASGEQNAAVTTFQIVQNFTVALASNPAGAGTMSGGGSYPAGSMVTVTARPNTSPLPYSFLNWSQQGNFQSTRTNYTFIITGNRSLTANFTLPSFQIGASNNPPAGGIVNGGGTYFYGNTNVLTASPQPGYVFTNWTESGVVVGTTPLLATIVLSNRFVVANYIEANPFHVVTTATSPAGLATIAGAGTYTNGQSGTFTAPGGVTNPPTAYVFRRFTLNGAAVSTNVSFAKTFSTADPTNIALVAEYDARNLLPLVVDAFGSVTNPVISGFSTVTNPVPAMTNYQLVLRFDRSMRSLPEPAIVLTNAAAPVQPAVPSGGAWFTTSVSNDTYRTPPIVLGNGMEGTNRVLVSGARDLFGAGLAPTNAYNIVLDLTAPANPSPVLISSNASSVTVGWSAYAAPADLDGFRVYLQTNNFNSVAGLVSVARVGAGSRSYSFGGLLPDTKYYVAVAAVDHAGNSTTAVSPLPVEIPSTLPPPVITRVSASGPDSALVDWNGYNTSSLFGFAGFQVYLQTTPFSSVAGLTPYATLGAAARTAQIAGLDRSQTYHIAVAGFNRLNQFNPTVTTAVWSDPYSGTLTSDLTIGGTNQSDVAIYRSIVVASNATLTVLPGTTLRFAAGAGLTVGQGRLVANGTALDPIIFTSLVETNGGSPAGGDWTGIRLGAGADASVLRHVWVKYGRGLTLDGCAPVVDAFTGWNNAPAGLWLRNGATLSSADGLLLYNQVGAGQEDTSRLNLHGSVIKNNLTNVWARGSATLVATQNWWGTAVASDIAGGVSGSVDSSAFLDGEPLLTPAVATADRATDVGNTNVTLTVACRTAESMRISEDSAFQNVFFQPFSPSVNFTLSEGAGQKILYTQFRSVTGKTNSPIALALNYITAAPVIQSFNLAEGQTLTRPFDVTGTATAVFGMSGIEFYLDNVLEGTAAGGSYDQRLDVRRFPGGLHRVKLVARDNSGNIATLQRNVYLDPNPPPAPTITAPAADVIVNLGQVNVSGTAEPFLDVRLLRSGLNVGATTADASGHFSFSNIMLAEGRNDLVAVGVDAIGSASSPARQVILDSGAPAALVMDPAVYEPGLGLALSWHFSVQGERATRFQLFWHTSPFGTTNEATGRTILLKNSSYQAQGLANGTYYFGVVGYDDAGNASPLSALVSVDYDAQPPVFTVSFDKPSPSGRGPLQVTLAVNETLRMMPGLTLRPAGGTPVLLHLTNSALNTYQGVYDISGSTANGPLGLSASGQDLAGNTFVGAPSGATMVVDVAPPAGRLSTAPGGPVQATNAVDVGVNLVLTEAVKPGTSPSLGFTPPTGALVVVPLNGNGSNWTGVLPVTPSMGSGFGTFAFTARDAVDNLGSNLLSGASLEIYNTDVPTPPAPPAGLIAQTLAGGNVRLSWNAVSNAEIYRVYRDVGSNATATTLVADNVAGTILTNLPPADGSYTFAVSAARRGAESAVTHVVGISDRTPPFAPTNVTAQLAARGVQISWEQPAGGETPVAYRLYRNGVFLRSYGTVAPASDIPPRGLMNYTVAAVDAAGNEARSEAASIVLLVGAVSELQVIVNEGQAPQLSWLSGDSTATGFNIYRNGILQNTTPQSGTNFTDNLPPGAAAVQYAVRAVNDAGQESPPRTVDVYAVQLGVLSNPGDSQTSGTLVTRYFDRFVLSVSNLTADASLPLRQLEVRRTLAGNASLVRRNDLATSVGSGNWLDQEVVFPSASDTLPQSLLVRAIQETDANGSSVIYQRLVDFTDVAIPGLMVQVRANQLPLAGGLSSFEVELFNRSDTPIDLITARQNGSKPGDLYISVKNDQGQEVSRTEYTGAPSGAFFLADGRARLRIAPGGSSRFSVPNVLVPEALSSNAVTTFEAVAGTIYYDLGGDGELASGPLNGSTVSSLAQTEYDGTAMTDKAGYSDNETVAITGQAIDRATGQPVPNAELKLGFSTRGYRWEQPVTTDANGDYRYDYNSPPGLAGSLTVWAAHPLVFDALNQARINIYRLYAKPPFGDIRMSKNDTLSFSIELYNPGDTSLTDLAADFQAYQMQGTNPVPVATVTGMAELGTNFVIEAGKTRRVKLELTAASDAPDNLMADFAFHSAEGASAAFSGTTTLLPAVPVLSVVDPRVGYLEVSLDRGNQLSRSITVVNRGLKDLQGAELVPPTHVAWMSVNLPAGEDGKIHLPDIKVGESNSFLVVFTPPADTALDYYQDSITIRGTNAQAAFDVNVYALVTSDQKGSVQFYVENILGQAVPNASIRLRNTLLQVELPTALTDSAGLVTVPDLQEGQWSWRAEAPGHSPNVGVVEVVPSQTVRVDTRLSKSLVTVSFSVVPVPYTDRYEIKLEQTFETHVPAPVLVLDPSFKEFNNVTPGFEANFIVTAKNHGLIQMTDLTIEGSQNGEATFTPLITYVPVLLPEQSVEIPFRMVYFGTGTNSQQGLASRQGGGANFINCATYGLGGFVDDIKNFINGLNALANAEGRCITDNSLVAIAGVIGITYYVYDAASTVVGVIQKPIQLVARAIGCLLGGLFSSDGGGGGPGGGPGQRSVTNFRGTGPACFAEGTPVLMGDGTERAIETVRPGDVVRTGPGPRALAHVKGVFSRQSDRLRAIQFTASDGGSDERAVFATEEHLFWVDGQGWTAAQALKRGDWVSTPADGRLCVAGNEPCPGQFRVYTLKLNEDIAFYAGGVLVHELCGDLGWKNESQVKGEAP